MRDLDEYDDAQCGNCDRLAPAEVMTYSVGRSSYEGPICDTCRDRPDADTCIRCGALWWSGVSPPYTEENSPSATCGFCWSEI